mmetsp:Transcript_8982/g.15620  ORF Transcript_8982/g.15620 Transcript_8982/m.15620 type:complete len:91 (+) Transcript_8982:56-328(+)
MNTIIPLIADSSLLYVSPLMQESIYAVNISSDNGKQSHMQFNKGRATKPATNADIAVETTFTISLERNPQPPTFVVVGPSRLAIFLASLS